MADDSGDYDQEARRPAGQYFQGPYLAFTRGITAYNFPQTTALRGIQRRKSYNPKHLEERFLGVIQPLEPTGRSADQDDLRFRLQGFT